jgi:hypothetical protein
MSEGLLKEKHYFWQDNFSINIITLKLQITDYGQWKNSLQERTAYTGLYKLTEICHAFYKHYSTFRQLTLAKMHFFINAFKCS